MRRSRTTGARAIQRVFRRVEPAVSQELFESIKEGADELLTEQRREVPVRSGRLRNALQRTIQRRSLTAKVGLVTKAARRKAPHGHLVVRGVRARGIPANNFIRRAQFNKAKSILARNRRALDKALRRVARGG